MIQSAKTFGKVLNMPVGKVGVALEPQPLKLTVSGIISTPYYIVKYIYSITAYSITV